MVMIPKAEGNSTFGSTPIGCFCRLSVGHRPLFGSTIFKIGAILGYRPLLSVPVKVGALWKLGIPRLMTLRKLLAVLSLMMSTFLLQMSF